MKIFIPLTLFVSCIMIVSCTYNKQDQPEPFVEEEQQGPSITYTNYTKEIIDNNCIVCHSSSGGQTPFLSTYSQVSAQKTRIVARAINNTPSAMPTSGPLPQTVKDTLQIWVNQGALQ